MRVPIGELLMDQGSLTAEQCQAILERQRQTHRPFGELAEEMFQVPGRDVERAWAIQYGQTTKWVDPTLEALDPSVRDLITRRQAWQFRILPMGYDHSDLMVCTTQAGLVRAMNFAVRQIPITCYFVLARPDDLANALLQHYPMDGMGIEIIEGEFPNWHDAKRRAC